MVGIEFLWFYHLNNIDMKKILIALIAALAFLPTIAEAQISVTSKSNNEKLLSIRMGFITLNYDGSYYLGMQTTNQFDNHMILPLGKTKEEAIKTVQALIDITTTIAKGDCITIESVYGTKFRIYRYAKNTITIHADGYAGYSNTNKNELTRILDTITFDVR